jgi:hypothetical protein
MRHRAATKQNHMTDPINRHITTQLLLVKYLKLLLFYFEISTLIADR